METMKYVTLLLIMTVLSSVVLAQTQIDLQTQIAIDDFECNGFNCGKGWNNIWSFKGDCRIISHKGGLDKYQMQGLSGCDAIRNVDTSGFTAVNLSFYTTASSLENGEYCRYYYFDGKVNHEIVTLANGQDDDVFNFHNIDITEYGLSPKAGIRMYGALSVEDYCYIDNIKFSGVAVANLNLFTKNVYITESVNVIEATSSITNTEHTIELRLPNETIFCTDTIVSPPIAFSMFATKCLMPSDEYVDAKAVMYITKEPTISTTNYYNITLLQQDPNELLINKVYFSPQVLQGGQTQIYAFLDTNLNISFGYVTINFPDGTSRIFGMYPTINENEFSALITDTYQTGNVGFIIKFESESYYVRYADSYNVVPFSVDYVANVGSVDSVSSVGNINVSRMSVHGTEYYAGQRGKVFLHLLDGEDQPINDSTCYTSIYYPNDQMWKYQQLMSYINEGLYVFSFDSPYTDGVYPVTAFCTLPAINISSFIVEDDFNSGSTSGGSGWNNNWDLDNCHYESGNVHEGAYSIECYNDREPNRQFVSNTSFQSLDYSFYWRGDSLDNAGEIVYYILKDASNTEFILKSITDGDDDGNFHRETGTLYDDTDGFDFDGVITFFITTTKNFGNADYYNIDLLEISLNADIQLNETAYEIVRGTGEIHVSSETNYIDTLSIGELTNESFLNYFIFHYDVVSLVSGNLTGQLISLPLWKQFPCAHVINVQEKFDNGSTMNLSYTGKSDDLGRCLITIEHDLEFGKIYDIEIISENYWRNKIFKDYGTLLLEEEMINISCQNYRLANNLSDFSIDYNTFTDGNDNMWLSCASYLDKANHFKEVFAQFYDMNNLVINFTYKEMESLESDWIHLMCIKTNANEYANTVFNGLNLGNSYSLGLIADPHPPTNPLYATYFASISTSYLNYIKITNASNTVWNYTDRRLTYYPPAEVNNTAVAESVWFWQGVIYPNILGNFSQSNWGYTARYTHGEDLT